MGYVLVTGSNGFVGSKLIDTLLQQEYFVLGLSRNDSLREISANYQHIKIDITQYLAIRRLFEEYEIDAVIHLAALAHLKNRKSISWNDYYRVNTLASKNLFQLAINFSADIFFASTVDVYGNKNEKHITENSTTDPVSLYGSSKVQAEKHLLNSVSEENNPVNFTIARFAPIYDKGYMKDVYKRIYLRYPSIAYKIGKEKSYHFVSVNNVIDFIVIWVTSRKYLNGIFNVADSALINSVEFIQTERARGSAKRIVHLPEYLIRSMNPVLKSINKIIKNKKLIRISQNLHKLTDPPSYSIKKMMTVFNPKWDIKNTVYIEDT